MKKYKFWVIIGILTLLICWLFYPQDFNNTETYLVVSSYLGRVVGLLILPAIVALIFKGFAKIFNKEFSSKSFRKTFFVVWIILGLSALTNFLYNSEVILSQETSTKTIQKKGFEFSPENNEYVVTFKEKPKIKETTFLNDLRSKTAELVLVNDGSFVRAESFSYNEELNKADIDKFYIVAMLKEYAKYNGFQYPEFNFEENKVGKIGKVRGYKTLKDKSGKEIEVTFVIRAYFGKNSGMLIHGTSPSEIYPTPEIVKFFNSLKKDA